jgi:hypothetical protein
MSHVEVLKRAWKILWSYRVVWVFGVILALTTVSWETAVLYGGGNDDSNGVSVDYINDAGGKLILNYKNQADGQPYGQGDIIFDYNPPDEFSIRLPYTDKEGNLGLRTWQIQPEVVSALFAVAIGLACLLLLLIAVAMVARYVGETALICLVDDYEETGEKRGLWSGVRMGWSRAAWRLFLIDVLIALPAVLAIILLVGLALSPLLLWTSGNTAAGLVGTVFAVGLVFLVICLAIFLAASLSLLKRFFWRACALDELGVTDSIRKGYALVRQNLKDVGLMWLIVLGINLAWPFMMIPIVLLLMAVAVVLGGVSALLVGGLAGLVLEGAIPWILAGLVGIPVFILALAAPLIFLGGLREVFLSSTWTLTYRDLHPLTSLERRTLPDLGSSGLEATPVV